MEKSEWMSEIRIERMVFAPGTEFSLIVRYLFDQIYRTPQLSLSYSLDAKLMDST